MARKLPTVQRLFVGTVGDLAPPKTALHKKFGIQGIAQAYMLPQVIADIGSSKKRIIATDFQNIKRIVHGIHTELGSKFTGKVQLIG
ncbi:MAG: hypothetical protein A2535_04510 [Burkholderiales bacterium RIFOXYD2_FULL_59_8]|nr:MAG: hypothetical protein A2535_04510 [Burkholderiales bacterium RIFOXYD2_FULL_59_8]